MKSWLRFCLVATLLAGVGIFLQARSRAETLPPRKDLASFPRQVGGWLGRDVIIQPGILEVLGAGEFLQRLYVRAPQEPYIDLFLAFFPTQRTYSTVHSPKNCLPGVGWTPIDSSRMQLLDLGGKSITVNRYLIAKGLDRQVVLYWYQAHGRAVASEYWAKFYLVADAIKMNRTDGALIRIVTPLASGEDVSSGQQRVVEFAQKILPYLETYIPH
jgi:EpsI family protein